MSYRAKYDQLIAVVGAGFVGRAIVRTLAAQGYRVRIVARHPHQAQLLKTDGAVGQISVVQGNVRCADSMNAALQGVDAAVYAVGALTQSGKQTFAALHVQGVHNFAQALQQQGITRAVLVSALGSNATSASAYARTKAQGEAALRALIPQAVILQPSVIFGADDQFFNRLAAMARFKIMPLIGGGNTQFQPVYVHNVAAAALAALQNPAYAGNTYVLGGPEVMTFAQCARYAANCAGRNIMATPIPFAVASVMGAVFDFLPAAPFTHDQVLLLQTNNVVPAGALGLADLGIEPTPVAAVVPHMLRHYRPMAHYDLGHGTVAKNNRDA